MQENKSCKKALRCPKTKNEYYTFFTQAYKNNKQAKSHMIQKYYVTFIIFSLKNNYSRNIADQGSRMTHRILRNDISDIIYRAIYKDQNA